MPQSPTRLLVSEQATLTPEMLQRFSERAECLQIASADGITLNGARTLLVLTPEQTDALLAQSRLTSPATPDFLAIIIWRKPSAHSFQRSLSDIRYLLF